MNKTYLLIGGNMGDREKNLRQAVDWLEKDCGRLLKASPVYETEAWGKTDQPAFLNQVLYISTKLTAPELLAAVLGIEKKLGRERAEKYGPRTIDIDILFFNNDIIHLPQLEVPHPQLQKRRFVLQPLAAIAPDLKHPVLHQTIQTLLDHCADPLEVKRVD